MRTSALILLALPTLLLACDPSQNLGGNNTTGSGGGPTGSTTGGDPGAGGGGTGGTSSGGTGGSVGTSGTSGTGGPSAPLACPPAVDHGTLATVPFTPGFLTYPWDLRFGQAHHYLLEDPWVDYTALDGQGATGAVTLDLNEGYQAMQVLPGDVSIPAAWQSADKLSAFHLSATNETILALKTKQSTFSSGQAPPGLAVDGTDVYWSLRTPARIVEAPLGGGNEWVIADYDASTGIVPLALAIDDTHVYWSTAKAITTTTFEGGGNNNRLYRVPRHSPGAVPELIASSNDGAIDAIALEGGNVHVGFVAGTSADGSAGGTVPKTGGAFFTWGLDATSYREGRIAILDGYVYYTEQHGSGCDGRLLRYPLAEISQYHFFKRGEVLVSGMKGPSNLIVHDGKVYFTTTNDPFVSQSSGGVFSLVPPAKSTCLTCGEVVNAGATDAVCGASDQKFMSLVVCGQQAGCSSVCQLPSDGVLSASCKSCLQQHCPTEESVCSSDNGA